MWRRFLNSFILYSSVPIPVFNLLQCFFCKKYLCMLRHGFSKTYLDFGLSNISCITTRFYILVTLVSAWTILRGFMMFSSVCSSFQSFKINYVIHTTHFAQTSSSPNILSIRCYVITWLSKTLYPAHAMKTNIKHK